MPSEFEKRIADYCGFNGFFGNGDAETVVVALSGGGDSVALLTVLVRISERYGFAVEAAHLNHALRGDESDADERFVRDLCADMSVPLTVEKLPTGLINDGSGSTETVARELRRAFLMRVAADHGASKIATGHTLDDQAETILQRIIRGTGPAGLAGILPMRDGVWIRPLLGVSRAEIRAYLTGEGISFRNDSSNEDTTYFRNRIRHELIPLLHRQFSPGITGSLNRLAELSRTQEEYLAITAHEAFNRCVVLSNSWKILLERAIFMDYHKVVKQRVIRYCLALLEGGGRDTDFGEVENVLAIVDQDGGVADITSSVRCGTGGGFIAFAKAAQAWEPVEVLFPGETVIPQGGGTLSVFQSDGNETVDGITRIMIAGGIVEQYGCLSVGKTMPGERMIPFGMKDSVKISDLVASTRIPNVMRESVPVVRAGAVPAWIPGLRSSEILRIPRDEGTFRSEESLYCMTFKDGIVWMTSHA